MNLSTVIQPCNASGYFQFGSRYGLASFDWSNAKAIWSANANDATNCSEVLVQQAKVVKAGNKNTRVFVYRNMLLALEWIRGQRVAMDDPSKSDYFLKYQSGPREGQIYNEPQFNGLRQYFWDYTNPDVVDHWIGEVTGPDAAGSPFVDGIFTDDVDGSFQEHSKAVANMGLSAAKVQAVEDATQAAYGKILHALITKTNGYDWQAFGAEDGTSGLLPTAAGAKCTATMRSLCGSRGGSNSSGAAVSPSQQPRIVSAVGGKEGMAGFLLARGSHWWMGWGWQGCSDKDVHPYDPIWDIDSGPPKGPCTEASTGVFERAFVNGRAALDCNTFTGTLDF